MGAGTLCLGDAQKHRKGLSVALANLAPSRGPAFLNKDRRQPVLVSAGGGDNLQGRQPVGLITPPFKYPLDHSEEK